MKRTLAILRCLWHALLPPALERLMTGRVHYRPWTWWRHAQVNFRELWKLATFRPLTGRERRFHKLEES